MAVFRALYAPSQRLSRNYGVREESSKYSVGAFLGSPGLVGASRPACQSASLPGTPSELERLATRPGTLG